MRRAGCCLGTLLMLIAFVALFGLVVIPVLPFGENNPLLMQIKGSLICDPGQQYVMVGHNFSDNRGSGRSFQNYCVAEDGTRINVMEKDFGISIVAFVVPFLIGLFLVIGASAAAARQRVTAFAPIQMTDNGVINAAGMQFHVQSSNPQGGAATLAHKLQELEDARTKGLITPDEYDKMRKRILDESI